METDQAKLEAALAHTRECQECQLWLEAALHDSTFPAWLRQDLRERSS